MVQGYYTLQQAAEYLDMSVDELKQMAQKGQIRSFQDRGNLRFRIQDIQELGRSRGGSSEPELVLGDAPRTAPKSAGTPSSSSRKTSKSPKSPPKKSEPEVFEFQLDDENVDVGADLVVPKSSKSGPRSGKKSSPVPAAGSDSDVRLVSDGSDVTFSLPKDSDIKLAESGVKPKSPPPVAPSGKRPSQLALESSGKTKSKLASGSPSSGSRQASPRPAATPQPVDSGVRLVPLDDDSDVKLHGSSHDELPLGEGGPPGASDSNVRLEKVTLPPADSGEGGMMLTEEINLDEEIKRQQEREKEKDQKATRVKAKSELKFPTSSPFELSDSDLEMPPELHQDAGATTPVKTETVPADSSDFELTAQNNPENGSSDFDLVPANEGGLLLEDDSSDFSLEAANEELVLEEQKTELTSSTSGISLDNPVDAGISLEDEESGDFDLSLEVEDTPRPSKSRPIEDSGSEFELAAKTPRPGKAQPMADSDGEFDLTLESSGEAPALEEQHDDSAFELNLDGSGEGELTASDSEFELTLDDSGNLEAFDGEDVAPQVKSKKRKGGEEQDIFESDFDVPALDGSDDATVADSELESSDFDLALDDSELAQEEESGSQVVALDEEDADTQVESSDDAAVVDDIEVEEESSDFADLDADVQVEEDDEVEVDVGEDASGKKVKKVTVIKEKLIEPAPWGVMPVLFMLPCVVIMFLVGILGYEMVQTTNGLRPPGPLTVMVGGWLDQKFTK
jgi:excisionase family DNA binding protein